MDEPNKSDPPPPSERTTADQDYEALRETLDAPEPKVVEAKTEDRTSGATEKVQAESDISSDNSETITDKQERERDEAGRFKAKADKAEQEAVEAEKPQVTDSPYTKAQKEEARLNRNRKEFEAEKAQIRAEAAALREEMLALRQEAIAQRSAAKTDAVSGYTADELEEYAKRFEAEGEDDLAAKARGQAKVVRAQEAEAKQTEAVQSFRRNYEADLVKVMKAETDLQKEDTPLSKAFDGVLKEAPLLSQIADGPTWALKLAKLKLDADMVPGLKEKLRKLETELAEARGATQLEGSGPTSLSAPKGFNDMSLDEMERSLRRELEPA